MGRTDLVEARLRSALGSQAITVATAESCTGGMLASAFVRIPGSGSWFRGGVIAYAPEVKFDLLGVARGPVVCERAARQMAIGAARLLDAELGIATTGVAGPEEEEGVAVGTVFIAAVRGAVTRCERVQFDGDPEQVRAAATAVALEFAYDVCREAGDDIS